MKDVYWGIAITLLGAIISLVKDWKKENQNWYSKSNILGIIGFLIITIGLIKSCSFTKNTLAEKKTSDSIANKRQDTVIKQGKIIVNLSTQLNFSLRHQLDTSITILNYSKNLIEVQNKLVTLQNENNQLQSHLYNQVIGGDKIDNSFVIPVIINTSDHLPIPPIYEKDMWKTTECAQLVHYARPCTMIKGKYVNIKMSTLNESSSIIYMEQVLQYKILVDLIQNQTEWSITANKKSNESASRDSLSLSHPFKLTNPDTIDGERIIHLFADRPISKDTIEKENWKNVALIIPKGTTISLMNNVKHKIILMNSGHFKMEFIIELLGSSLELPKDVVIDKTFIGKFNTCYYTIQINAIFYNIQNPETVEYKKWAEWEFKGLKKTNYAD